MRLTAPSLSPQAMKLPPAPRVALLTWQRHAAVRWLLVLHWSSCQATAICSHIETAKMLAMRSVETHAKCPVHHMVCVVCAVHTRSYAINPTPRPCVAYTSARSPSHAHTAHGTHLRAQRKGAALLQAPIDSPRSPSCTRPHVFVAPPPPADAAHCARVCQGVRVFASNWQRGPSCAPSLTCTHGVVFGAHVVRFGVAVG